jgi:hypothetical protein
MKSQLSATMIGILLIGSVPLVGWATDDKAQADQTATVNPPVKKTRARLPDTEPATVLCSDGDSEGDTEKAEATASATGLHAWFSLERPSGRRYRRPYIAVWLEDSDGFPVKTGVLWMQTDQPGPRWHRDLTRWFRNDRMRKVVEKTNLIDGVDGISGATRGPGQYEVHFDGTDNGGKALPNGEYTLCLEAAREHGTYKIIREKFTWGSSSIPKKTLKGNIEIPIAAYEFLAPQS